MVFLTFSQSFTYDGTNRLTQGTDSGGWSRNFSYDNWGNMWVPSATGPLAGNTPTTNVYNSGTNRDGRYTYDSAGNLLTVNGNNASYNAENQLAALSTTTGGSEAILYDAVGNRVKKVISGGSTTVYVYDAFGLATEYVGGSWAKDFIKEGGKSAVATENASGPCMTCYYAVDHLGSVRLVMDQNANVVGRHDYLPYGDEIAASTAGRDSNFGSTTDVTEKFTGQVRDQESGVDYFNARYFTAALGRLNSVDPGNAGASLLSSQSWNQYAYVRNNPLSLVDPAGLAPCNVWNVTYEGSGGDFPCSATTSSQPNPYQVVASSGAVVNTGSNLGNQSPELAEGEAQYLNYLRFGASWGWVAGDDPLRILAFFGVDQNTKSVPGAAALAMQALGTDSCAGIFNNPLSSPIGIITTTHFAEGTLLAPDGNPVLGAYQPLTNTIVFNTQSVDANNEGNTPAIVAAFPALTKGAAAGIIIHEIIHSYVQRNGIGALSVPGTTSFFHWTQNDQGDLVAESMNKQIVDTNCGAGR